MAIPQDPVILLSFINTQLRDFYPNLSELCQSLDLNEEEIRGKLRALQYEYNEKLNQFK